MWRFCDRLLSRLFLLGVLLLGSAGVPAADDATAAGVLDRTTAGRKLLKAALPSYPPEEQGRWTQSCVALYFTVRPDGKTDQFVVLESARPNRDERKFDNLPKSEQEQESRAMWRFVQPSVKALYAWEYAPASKASEEIAVFLFERSEMGGRVMKVSARRLDLRTPDPVTCGALDPAKARELIAKARGH